MFRYTEEPKLPHPADRDDALAQMAIIVAFFWGVCVVLGVVIYGGWL